MVVWNFIILLIGLFMLCAHRFIVDYSQYQLVEQGSLVSLVQILGLAITLISIGIGVRVAALRRRGEKEKLAKAVATMKEKLPPAAEEKPQAPAEAKKS